jgi:tripartite-type tricarboxylate transporter receptor subunit TctC
MLSMSNVAKSLPDGYTLGIGVSGTLTTGPHLQKTKLYDPLTDFESIGMVSKAPMVLLAGPSFKYDSVSALIREAKARPGEIMFASGAQAFELALKLFNTQANINLGSIPYAGGAQASVDVLGGRVPLMVDTIGAQQENIKAGKLRALAMLDSKRSPLFPDIPTMAESGLTDYEAVGWISLVAAKGTPQPIVKKLNQQLQQVLEKPEVRQKLLSIGFEPSGGTPNDLMRTIQTDYAKWGQIIKAAGMTPQ